MKCIIIAAGYATRLYPLTENFPKPLLKVGDRTILDWLIDDIETCHLVDEYIVVTNHKFAHHFQQWATAPRSPLPAPRLPITVVDDGTSTNETRLGAVRDIQLALDAPLARPAGTLDPSRTARSTSGRFDTSKNRSPLPANRSPLARPEGTLDPSRTAPRSPLTANRSPLTANRSPLPAHPSDYLIMAGDNLLSFSLCKFIAYAQQKGTSCIMRYYEPDEQKLHKTGVAEVDDNDMVLSMVEKPAEPKSHWCCPPFYYITKDDVPKVSEAIDSGCGVDAPGSFIAWLCKHVPVHAMQMPGPRYDIGNLESYEQVQRTYKGIIY